MNDLNISVNFQLIKAPQMNSGKNWFDLWKWFVRIVTQKFSARHVSSKQTVIRTPLLNNTKRTFLRFTYFVKFMIYVNLFSSLNVSFCKNISDMHFVLLLVHNVAFDEYVVIYLSSGFSISVNFLVT